MTQEEKRVAQVRDFIKQTVPTLTKTKKYGCQLDRPYLGFTLGYRQTKRSSLFDSGPDAFNLLVKEAIAKKFLGEQTSNVCDLVP